ncbi:MAG: 6-bladed beta-propeller [Candidatus Aquicultorales bacterium]
MFSASSIRKAVSQLLFFLVLLAMWFTSTGIAGAMEEAGPPRTNLSVAPMAPDGTDGWFRTAPSIILASDRLANTLYRWDDGPWLLYSIALKAPEGEHALSYYSRDSSGTEKINEVFFKVDSVVPTRFELRSPVRGEYVGAKPTLSWSGSVDDGSRIAAYRLYIDGQVNGGDRSPASTMASPSSALTNGVHNWYVVAVDAAGNTRKSVSSGKLVVDAMPPEPFALVHPLEKSDVEDADPLFSWKATRDNSSGIANYRLYVDGRLDRNDIPPSATSIISKKALSTTYNFVFTLGPDRFDKPVFVSGRGLLTEPWPYGEGDAQYRKPRGVGADEDGNIYIVDTYNNRIQKFLPDGAFVSKWGSYGTGAGQFNEPLAMAVDKDKNIYVADTKNHRIQKFDVDGAFIVSWGSFGNEESRFNQPSAVACDSSGNVYVADSLNHRIQKFSSNGEFVTAWGGIGVAAGRFNQPMGVAVDQAEDVYVADHLNNRVQKFDSNGAFIDEWGSYGKAHGQFKQPTALAVDSAGSIFVTDTFNHRIEKFTGDGVFIGQLGALGLNEGQFNLPAGVAVAVDDSVVVADTENSRVQVLREGYHTWYVTAVDVAGNERKPDAPSSFAIRGTGRGTLLSSPNPDEATGWFGAPPSVGFSRSEPGITYYQFDATTEGGWLVYFSDILVPEGEHTLYYYSVDASGQEEEVRKQEFKVRAGG